MDEKEKRLGDIVGALKNIDDHLKELVAAVKALAPPSAPPVPPPPRAT